MQRNVPSGTCIFDLYQKELSDGSNIYTMYVIINRTEEVTMRSKLQRGYLQIVNILQDMLHSDMIDADIVSQEKLNEIKDQAEAIACKYGLYH